MLLGVLLGDDETVKLTHIAGGHHFVEHVLLLYCGDGARVLGRRSRRSLMEDEGVSGVSLLEFHAQEGRHRDRKKEKKTSVLGDGENSSLP